MFPVLWSNADTSFQQEHYLIHNTHSANIYVAKSKSRDVSWVVKVVSRASATVRRPHNPAREAAVMHKLHHINVRTPRSLNPHHRIKLRPLDYRVTRCLLQSSHGDL
jgi:hypothetical protein